MGRFTRPERRLYEQIIAHRGLFVSGDALRVARSLRRQNLVTLKRRRGRWFATHTDLPIPFNPTCALGVTKLALEIFGAEETY